MKKVYNKLVRDKVIDVIINNKETPVYKTLDDPEFKKHLIEKLQEETKEVLYAETDDALLEELAEVLEIVFAIADINEKREELLNIMKKKRTDRGSYKKRIFLEGIE